MADRYPLIANPATSQIQELASGDNIDLTGNDIVGVKDITATGTISTTGQISAGGISYPTTTGNDGQVLTSDGAGGSAWEDSSVSGLPSGDAGESIVFDGNNWVLSPPNFAVETTASDPDWNSVTMLIPFNEESGTPGTASWSTPVYGSIAGTDYATAGVSTTITSVGTVELDDRAPGAQRIKFGDGAGRFQGSDTGYMEFGGSNASSLWDLGSGDFTLEFWFLLDNLVNDQKLVSVDSTSGSYDTGCWYIEVNSNGTMSFWDHATSTHHYLMPTAAGIAADTWYHCAISRINGEFRGYIDGIKKFEATVETNFTADANALLYGARLRLGFGDQNDNNGMTGNLDDFRITKGAGRYDAANFTPPTQGFATTATPTYGDITYPLTLHTDVDLVTNPPTNGQVFTWDATGGSGNNGAWVPTTISGGTTSFVGLTDTPAGFTADKWLKVNSGGTALEFTDAPSGSSYTDSDVDTHLNQSNPTSGHVLSWNGSDYAWVAQSGGGGGGASDLIEEGNTSVETIDTGTDGTIKFETEGTDRWKITSAGHIIPYANAAYDLGNASYKVRHLFLSDNSLWIGDEHKVSTEGGKMKFKKRKKSVVPASITAAGGDAAGALAHSGKASLDLIFLNEWIAYLTSLDPSKTQISDLLPPESSGVYTENDYDEIDDVKVGRGSGNIIENTSIGNEALVANTTGKWNTATGGYALHSNTEGDDNTAYGSEALKLNTTGDQNTAVGAGALWKSTEGNYNTALGYAALQDNTTGDQNTACGNGALAYNTIGNYNTATGIGALWKNTEGNENTANGLSALRNNTTGSYNTAVGENALYTNTIGTHNTAIGLNSLYLNTEGINNTASGYGALYNNTTGAHNTASGLNALNANTTGSENAAHGYEALKSNTTGKYNTASGAFALQINSEGDENTASGYAALSSNTTGQYNTASGAFALQSNTTGSENAAHGHKALNANTTGTENTASGVFALGLNNEGTENTAIGYAALYTNTTGTENTASGAYALFTNSTGKYNTAIGYSALNKTTADSNTASGYLALFSNTTGANNTASGAWSLYNNIGGVENTALGDVALYTCSSGSYNTSVGRNSLYSLTTGQYNTGCGWQANGALTTGNYNSCFGAKAQVSAVGASGEVVLGDGNVGTLRCNTQTISALSDARDKKEVEPSPLGVDFLNKLNPVKFLWDSREGNVKDGTHEIGFIAQELQEVQKETNTEYLKMVIDANPDRLEASYGQLVPILVQAIKELSTQVEQLQSEISHRS